MTSRVVVTGLGAITPLGIGADTLLSEWCAGNTGIEGGFGRCADFDPLERLSTKEVRRSDRCTQLVLSACIEALEQAGWGEELPYPRERIGCVIGTGIGGLSSIESQCGVLRDRGAKAVSPLAVPLMMANAGAGAVAMSHDLRGPNFGVVSACAAGAHALGAAVGLVRSGQVDAVVSGGGESALTPLAVSAFASMGATSPSGISRPFDARRDGFVMGEGAGVLVLEALDGAVARGAEILGEILGYAATADAFHITAPVPGGRGAAVAMAEALRQSELEPGDIAYVNAHGTSTPLNDRSETEAIKVVFGEHAYRVPVSSLKSATGHLLGASGAIEAIVSLLALRRRVAPPTLGYGEVEEGLDLDYVADGARPLAPATSLDDGRTAGLSNSFGFGGHNAVLCLAA